jgi:serine/threonine protein kinase
VDTHVNAPSQPGGGFSTLDASLGTKLSAGAKVGEYQILDRIGEGGMGTVYSAVHPIIGKKVAIKVLSTRLAKNKNATRRFVLEARAVNDIQHPGLVDIFSFGRLTDGRHYYVMEFLDGRNLGDELRARVCLPVREALPIFLEVGRVLVAVHAKGIVHRDLKPENILLLHSSQAGAPKVKLVDFGLAKLMDGVPAHLSDSSPHTAAGVNVGTPHYMSPEQCRGLKVDARSDLYALGVLLYESLTGKLPFDGPSPVDIWQAHAEKTPCPPIEVAPGLVTAPLNSLILCLLAKRPEQRIQSASDFCAALEGLSEDGQLRSTPPPLHLNDAGSGLRHLSRATSPGAYALRADAYDEMATTSEDLPIVHLPEVEFTDEERRKEIEDLRTSLGLRIEEPASDSQEEEQISALVINLGPSRSAAADAASRPADERHSIPLPAASANLHRPSRRIEERNYLPPLAAPSSRTGGAGRAGADGAARTPSRLGVAIRVVLVVALLVAASVVAFKFVK